MAVERRQRSYTLDPVTFEVLKNAFSHDRRPDGRADPAHLPLVRHLRARLLVGALRPRTANTIMQGSQDIAVHVGTLHFTCKAVIEAFGERHAPGRRLRDQRPVPRRHALQRRPDRAADLPRRRAHRLRPVQRPLGGHRRQRARARSTSTRRSTSARACGSRPCGSGTRAATCDDVVRHDRLQHARAERRRGRPALAGRGDARRRARDPAARRQVRPRDGR